jgi:hypothetical protein
VHAKNIAIVKHCHAQWHLSYYSNGFCYIYNINIIEMVFIIVIIIEFKLQSLVYMKLTFLVYYLECLINDENILDFC